MIKFCYYGICVYIISQLQQNNDPLNKQYGSTTQSFQSQSFEKSPSASQYNNTGTASQGFSNQPYVNQNSSYVNATYQAVNNSYGQVQSEPTPAQQPSRTKTQRARVPPPSKVSIFYYVITMLQSTICKEFLIHAINPVPF